MNFKRSISQILIFVLFLGVIMPCGQIGVGASGGQIVLVKETKSESYGCELYIDDSLIKTFQKASVYSYTLDSELYSEGLHAVKWKVKYAEVIEESYETFSTCQHIGKDCLSFAGIDGTTKNADNTIDSGCNTFYVDLNTTTPVKSVSLGYISFGKVVPLSTAFSQSGSKITITPGTYLEKNKLHFVKLLFQNNESYDLYFYANTPRNIKYNYIETFDETPNIEVINQGGGVIGTYNKQLQLYEHMGTSSASYFDIEQTSLNGVNEYVIECLIKVKEVGNGTYIELFDGRTPDANWRLGARINPNGTIVMNNTTLYNWTPGENILYQAAYNVSEGKCKVYINGVKRGEISVGNLMPYRFRVDLSSDGSGNVSCWIDNLKIYEAAKPALENSSLYNERYSVLDNHTVAVNALSDKMAFTDSEYYFYNGKKEKYSAQTIKPLIENGKVFVTESFLRNEMGMAGVQIGTNTSTKQANDNTYYLLDDILSQNIYADDRGFFVVSENEYEYKDSKHFLTIFEVADVIYRYLSFTNPRGEEILSDMERNNKLSAHPRILYDADDINYINSHCYSDETIWVEAKQRSIKAAENEIGASSRISAFCSDSEKYSQAVTFQNAIISLATGYLLTGNESYANEAVKLMETISSWQNLGYSTSNLTTGHWAMGMAVGYDTFYKFMNQSSYGKSVIAKVKDAVSKLPFGDTKSALYGNVGVHWMHLKDNFQGVIGGGITALALAFADDVTMKNDLIYILENSLKTNEIMASLYGNDGGYFEGLSYSDYGLDNFTKGLEAILKCTGDDYGFSNCKGFTEAGGFFNYMETPEHLFGFSDCVTNFSSSMIPYWFAYRYGKVEDGEIAFLQNSQRNENISLWGLFYYSKAVDIYGKGDITKVPLDKNFENAGVISFRDSFIKDNQTFFGIHGGWTGVTHDMLDAGQFVFMSDGVQWAIDLGGDDYSLPNYFGTKGYEIYRKRPEGENCVVINPSVDTDNYYGQAIGEKAKLKRYETSDFGAIASYDLSDIYKRDVTNYERGFYFGDNRNTVLIRDEISLKNTSELYWFMHTRADIEIKNNNTAILRSDGKELLVEIKCSDNNFLLGQMDAEPLDCSPKVEGQANNVGVKKLFIHSSNISGDVDISVKLTPMGCYFESEEITSSSISSWELPFEDDTPAISKAEYTISEKISAEVYLPREAIKASIYLNNEFEKDIDCIVGTKINITPFKPANIKQGSNCIGIKVLLADGSVKWADTFFYVPRKNEYVFYENSFANSSSGSAIPTNWQFTILANIKKYTDGCISLVGKANESNVIDLRVTNPNACIKNTKTKLECNVKFSNTDGYLVMESQNSNGQWFLHDKYIFKDGKLLNGDAYSKNVWYKLEIELDSVNRNYSIFVDGNAQIVKQKLDIIDSVGLFKFSYVTPANGNFVSVKDYKITNYIEAEQPIDILAYSNNKITIISPEEKNAFISCAAFNKDKLVDIKIFRDVTLLSGYNKLNVASGFNTNGAQFIKIFVWDNIESLKPWCKELKYNLH